MRIPDLVTPILEPAPFDDPEWIYRNPSHDQNRDQNERASKAMPRHVEALEKRSRYGAHLGVHIECDMTGALLWKRSGGALMTLTSILL